MAHPSGAGSRDDLRLDFDRRVRLEFRGSQLSSDGGLLIVRELDDALGFSDLASVALADPPNGCEPSSPDGRAVSSVRVWPPRRI